MAPVVTPHMFSTNFEVCNLKYLYCPEAYITSMQQPNLWVYTYCTQTSQSLMREQPALLQRQVTGAPG